MWEKLKKWCIGKAPYILVAFLAFTLIVINFPKREWLMGWDNLSTELNVGMNISRNLSGVWQEYQGLGLLAGMAHMADLVRLVVQWMLSYIVPTMYLRSGMNLGMLLVGSLGMVKLVKSLMREKKYVNWAATLAAIFYLFNLGTVQNFWVVFEPFAWAYGFIPWLFAYLVNFLADGNKKSLTSFLIISLLATPMAYLQTIFVVYFFIILCLALGYLIDYRKIALKDKLKRIVVVLAVIIGVNSFWLLPQAYFFVTSVDVTVNAKMNTIATPEVELSNQSRGSLLDVMKMEGYWLDLHDLNEQGSFGYLMRPWVQYLENGNVQYMQYIVIGLIFVGLVGMYIFNYPWKWSITLSAFAAIGLLQNYNEPFGFGWLGLYKFFPILDQIFRSSFTKVIVLETVIFSILFGVSLHIFIDIYRCFFKKGIYVFILIIFLFMTRNVMYMVLPILKGELIYKRAQKILPPEYLELNTFFKTASQGRILKLPASSLWGWQFNNWGYDGSGFLWYGIEQPILDRAFDVWSPYNEGFYDEFSNSLYSCSSNPVLQCSSGVAKVLDKYDVRYVLLDESVIAPGQGREILRIEETKKLADELGWERVFNENFLNVWDTGNRDDQFVSAPSSYTVVSGDTIKTRRDVLWDQVGTYVEYPVRSDLVGVNPTRSDLGDGGQGTAIYPFANLMREEVKGVEYGERKITVSYEETPPAFGVPTWPSATSPVEESPQFMIPGWKVGDIVRVEFDANGEPFPVYRINGVDGPRFLGKEKPEEGKNIIYARISARPEWEEYLKEQKFGLQGKALKIEVPGEPQIYDFGRVGQGTIGNCDVLKRGTAGKRVPIGSDLPAIDSAGWDQPLRSDPGAQGTSYIADGRGATCDYVVMPQLDTRLSYLMRIQGENVEGRSLKFFLWNTSSKRNDIEWLLKSSGTPVSQYSSGDHFDSSFGLMPWSWDGYYTLNIETRSFGQRAENIIQPVEVRWFPLEQIAGARIESQSSKHLPIAAQGSELEIRTVRKYGTWLYIVETKNGGLLKLSQGYDDGWVSPYLEHLKVDGWANGWVVPAGDHQIFIFYWPQLLEYLGFALLAVTLVYVIRVKDKDK